MEPVTERFQRFTIHKNSAPQSARQSPGASCARTAEASSTAVFEITPNQVEEIFRQVFEKTDDYTSMQERVRELRQQSIFKSGDVDVTNVLAKGVQIFANTPLFAKGVTFLIENGDLGKKWLKELLPPNQSDDITIKIAKAIGSTTHGKKIIQQYERLCGFEKLALKKTGALAIAIFGSLAFEPGRAFLNYYDEGYGLPHPLQLDRQKKRFSILSERCAVQVPCNPKYSLNQVGHAVMTQDSAARLHQKLYEKNPGGIAAISMCDYRVMVMTERKVKLTAATIKEPVWESRTSVITELMPQTFGHFFKQASQIERLGATQQLLTTLAKLHQDGYIYGSVHEATIGYGQSVKLTDFKNTFAFSQSQSPDPYKAQRSGPPEFLGNTAFTGDWTKVEIWMAGDMLYRLYTGKGLPWDQDFGSLRTAAVTNRPQIIETCKKSMEEFRPSVGNQDEFLAFIHTLLCSDVATRPNAATAAEQLTIVYKMFIR